MRILKIVALCAALGGCGASRQAVVARPADQLVGQNLDTLVARFGPPTSSSKIDNDQGSYVWQLGDAADSAGKPVPRTGYGGLYGDGESPSVVSQGYSPLCKINIITSPTGTVTRASTEESNGTGAAVGIFDVGGSICAQRLGTKSQT
jgi:hypothetical protein